MQTATTIVLLVLYLMQNPRVQQKAHEEISQRLNPTADADGPARLPTWTDLPHLPYLHLVLQETYRMSPLSPLGIPHASLRADAYRGHRIPAGTTVYANVWAMHHDPATYRDSALFFPERYLPVAEGGWAEPLPVGNFGFGRRACVGRNLAENSLLVVLAMLVAATEIRFPLDARGERTPFEPEWSLKGQA
jgi:cytochrome P450